MKNFLLFLFGGLGLGSLLGAAAELTIPHLGGLRSAAVAAISITIWIPTHRWLTHRDPGPCEETFPPGDFFAPDKHEHRCTKRATVHAEHTCVCGMSWQPAPWPSRISIPDPLTDEQAAAFKTEWERVHRDWTTHLINVIDPATGKEHQK